MTDGTDISSHQHPHGQTIDFAAAKRSGQCFVIVKATEGATYTNPYFTGETLHGENPRRISDVASAKAAGLRVEAYHWVSPTSSPDAQVANILRAVKRAGYSGRVWLDFEQPNASHATLDAIRSGLHGAKVATGTYTYPWFWRSYGDHGCSRCAADPLWFAWAFPETPTVSAVAKRGFTIAPWREVTVWQWAGTSVAIPGIPGLNDADRLLLPLPGLSPDSASPVSSQEDDVYMLRTPDGEIDLVIGSTLIHLDGPGYEFYRAQGIPLRQARQQDGDRARQGA